MPEAVLLQGSVYLLGTGSDHGLEAGVCIQRLDRGAATWQRSVLFPATPTLVYNTGATPVVQAQGRIWRAVEAYVRPLHCLWPAPAPACERSVHCLATVCAFLGWRAAALGSGLRAAHLVDQTLTESVQRMHAHACASTPPVLPSSTASAGLTCTPAAAKAA